MVASSRPSASKATKKTGMTQEQKDAHNARCRESRKKLKIRREELEKMESEHLQMVPKYNQMRAEFDKINTELQEKNSRIRFMEIEIQELRAALQKQGQNFTSFEESVAWFTSQSYGQVGEGSASEYTNLSFSAADGDLSSLFGAPTDYGPGPTAGFWTASVVFDHEPDNDGYNNTLISHDLIATASDAGSPALNHGLTTVDSANASMGDLFSPHPSADHQEGFMF